jgi:trimeric autotransporter adhesin
VNKIYRLIWNKNLNALVAVGENTASRGKQSAKRRELKTAVAGVAFAFAMAAGATSAQENAGGALTKSETTGTADATSTTQDDGSTAKDSNSKVLGSAMLLGATSSKTPDQLIVSGPTTLSTPTDAIGNNAIAIGLNSHANADYAVAMGQNTSVLGSNGVAIGQNVAVTGISAVAIGSTVSSVSARAVAIGTNGTEVNTNAEDAVAIGSGVSVGGQRTVAIGSNIIASTGDSVVLGSNSSDDGRGNTVSVGASAVPGMGTSVLRRQIINVAAGTQDTDAVNVSQLKGVTASLGAGSVIDANGNVKRPSYLIGGNTYNDVGSALSAIDAKSSAGGVGGVQYDQNGDGTANYGKVTLAGVTSTDGGVTGGTKVTNVAAGDISQASTDAVNGAQLYAVAGDTGNTYITKYGTGVRYVRTNDNTLQPADAQASGIGSTAVGYNASTAAGATESLAVGANTSANGAQAAAIGAGASADGAHSVALGVNSLATGELSIALGNAATSNDNNAVAIGSRATATGAGSVALGAQAATGLSASVAIGNGAKTVSIGSTALGFGAQANQSGTVALGSYAVASTGAGVAGLDPITGKASTIGTPTWTATQGAVSVGDASNGYTRQIANVAAGTADTDVVNVAQLKAVATVASGVSDSAVKYDTDAGGTVNHGSVTLAGSTSIDGGASGGTRITNLAAAALNESSTDAVNGAQLYATNQAVNSLDGRVTQNTTDITNISNQINNGSVGLVQQAQAGADLTVGKDTDGAAVDFADKNGTTRRLAHVSAGAVNATSTDGVNGSQLYGVSKSAADAFGGGSTVNADGTISAPSYVVHKHDGSSVTFNNVGDAITNIDGRVVQNTTDITNISNQINSGEVGLVKQDTTTRKITVAKDTDGDTVDVTGTDGDRTVTGVKAGKADNDAVNVSQLKQAGIIDDKGNTLDAVVYDAGSNRSSITFGGRGATAPVILHNVAAGVADNDAVNMAQLNKLQGQVTNIDARVTTIENNGGGTGGGTGKVPYIDGNANGNSANPASAGDTAGVAVGYNSNASGDNASAMGQNATATGNYGTAVGNDSYAAGAKDTALGGNAKVHADGSVAVGANSTVAVQATNAVAVGADASVNAASGTAVGQGATVNAGANGAVALGQGAVADRAATVSVGSAGHERQIANVKAGVQQTDAVNVSQLQGVTNAMGGGAGIDNNGNVVAPNYSIAGSSYNNVGDALQGISSQLNDNFDRLNNSINKVNRQANRGIASSAALVTATPYMPGRTTVNAGMASYRGEAALGVGISRWNSSGKVNFNAGVSAARGDVPVFRVGVGLVLGD